MIRKHSLVFALSSLFFSIAFGQDKSCSDQDNSSYYIKGNSKSTVSERVIRFDKLKKDLLMNIASNQTKKTECLYSFYQKNLSETSEYWAKNLAQQGCSLNPKSGKIIEPCNVNTEAKKSTQYLINLDEDFRIKVSDIKEQSSEIKAAKLQQSVSSCQSKQSNTKSLFDVNDSICCGDKNSNKQLGIVRETYSSISYLGCLAKIKPTKEKFLSSEGILNCLGNIIKGAIQKIWDDISGLFKLPGELWGARSALWSILTDAKARSKFTSNIMQVIEKFFVDKIVAFKCLNEYEKGQYLCKTGGEIIAQLIMPETVGSFLKLASKPLAQAMRSFESMMKASKKGAAVLKNIEKVSSKVKSAADKISTTGQSMGSKLDDLSGNSISKVSTKISSSVSKIENTRVKITKPLTSQIEKTTDKIIKSDGYKEMVTKFFTFESNAQRKTKLIANVKNRVDYSTNENATSFIIYNAKKITGLKGKVQDAGNFSDSYIKGALMYESVNKND